MIEAPTVKVDIAKLFRNRATITVHIKPTRLWRVRTRLWLATKLWWLGTWVAQQGFEVDREKQP